MWFVSLFLMGCSKTSWNKLSYDFFQEFSYYQLVCASFEMKRSERLAAWIKVMVHGGACCAPGTMPTKDEQHKVA